MADIHYDDGEENNLEVHHEESDVNVRAILWFLGISVVGAVVLHFAMLGLFRVFRGIEEKKTGAPISLVAGQEKRLPPEPRLQPFPPTLQEYPGQNRKAVPRTPSVDMSAMRTEENRQQTTWGWVDQQRGIVRMPIDHAMELALQRGFAVHQQNAPVAVPVVDPAMPGAPEAGADGTVTASPSATTKPMTAQPAAAATAGAPVP